MPPRNFLFLIAQLLCFHGVVIDSLSGASTCTRPSRLLHSNLGKDGTNHRLSTGFHCLKQTSFYQPAYSRYNGILRASKDEENSWFFKPPIIDEALRQSDRESLEDGILTKDSSPKGVFRTSTLTKQNSKSSETRIIPATTVTIRKTTPAKPELLGGLVDEEKTSPLDFSSPQTIFGIAAVAGVAAVTAISYSLGLSPDDFAHGAQTLASDPQAFLQQLIEGVKELGPMGVVYYALIYMIAEILAIPATPLTLSAGYLFGLQQGILTVLVGATGAACIGFWLSRTFLRDYVESTLLAPSPSSNENESPSTLAKLDKAIGQEGFKLLVLIRLSPIFPFSVTNYLYGASSMDFGPYLLGTLIGFVPTTAAYVYTGMIGQALTVGEGGDQPWYVYAVGLTVLAGLVKLVTDVATGIIETIEDEV